METVQIDPAQIDLLITFGLTFSCCLAFCLGFASHEAAAK